MPISCLAMINRDLQNAKVITIAFGLWEDLFGVSCFWQKFGL
ncbi:hypothetical protein HPMG_00855 [Helicobacter pullorum MIT 98-5489]|uniref:Uncharacterized protein n=1 Tax=Helicobacter pullorum MIT 98-5489 TaxID=537972 RepID=C5EYQ0_9HELI|nr:hypothetical protein HPMG_00855 [Helicobacter pullorum MIT 98-5489]